LTSSRTSGYYSVLMEEKRLYGIRGAIRCENTAGDIVRRVVELYDELLTSNDLCEENIVSLVFSVTSDITALNPAAALRRGGRAADLALFSVAEPDTLGSLSLVIRTLIHCYLPAGSSPKHVYLNGAEVLRPDRSRSEGK
jgi:chorismate mutase